MAYGPQGAMPGLAGGNGEFINLDQQGAGGVDPNATNQFFTGARLGGLAANKDVVLRVPWSQELRGPGGTPYRPGHTPPGRAVQASRRMSVEELFRQLYALDDDALIHLQQQLIEAGIIDKPTWGVVDAVTRQGVADLAAAAAADPSRDMWKVLHDLTSNPNGDQSIIDALNQGDPLDAAHQANILQNLKPIEVTDPNVLRETADQVAQTLLGRDMTPEERKQIFALIQGRERNQQTQENQYNLAVADRQSALSLSQSGGSGSGEGGGNLSTGMSQIDQFMAAISGKESGGNYDIVNRDSGASGRFQIMPYNWSKWAVEAGLPSNAPRTPENQDRVAKAKMLQYYKKYGNWRDVAIAWYGGGGGVEAAHRGGGNASQGRYPTINQYADDVVSRMGASGGVAPNVQQMLDSALPAQPEFSQIDPSAETAAYIRAHDPAGYAGHRFAQQASAFEELLAGPGGPS